MVLHRVRVHWPEVSLFALACGLALLWFGGAAAILALPFALLGGVLIADRRRSGRDVPRRAADPAALLRAAIDDAFDQTRRTSQRFACILARLDEDADGVGTPGLDRMSQVIRREDALFRLAPGRVAVLLSPGTGLNRRTVLAIADRLQAALAGPDTRPPGAPPPSAPMVICLDDALTDRTGRAMIDAVETTLAQAARDGPSAIRFHGDTPAF